MPVIERDPWCWADPEPPEAPRPDPTLQALWLALVLFWPPRPVVMPGPAERAGCPGL
jgi:hypothetical protein